MKLILLSGKIRSGLVGQSLRHPITVLVTADDGTPHENEQVNIRAEKPETLEFEGSRGYAILRTGADGRAEVHVSPLKAGTFKYIVTAGTEMEEDTIEARDDGVRQVGDVTLVPDSDGSVTAVQNRGINPPPSRRPQIRVIG